MSGRLEFGGDAAGFFPKLAKAACEGARGVIDASAWQVNGDSTLQAVSGWGQGARAVLGACTGTMPLAEPPPEAEPRPWDELRTHAELNAWAEEQDPVVPAEWFALTIEGKKAWLDENFPWP